MKIAIVGLGTVGGSFAKVLEERTNHKILKYDPAKNFNDDISDTDIVFVCVYTEIDHENLTAALNYINDVNENALIVIRTTVIPGTTNKASKIYKREMFFMPEFLREASALEDMRNPDKVIVGCDNLNENYEKLVDILSEIYPDKKSDIITVSVLEAEIAKVALNSLALIKVIFANELYDICEVFGADYYNIYSIFKEDQNINIRHLDPLHGGFRGAGGKCLPKDIDFLIESAIDKNLFPSLMMIATLTNKNFLDEYYSEEKDEV